MATLINVALIINVAMLTCRWAVFQREYLQRQVKDQHRAALVDAYTKKPTADAIAATKALEILAEEIDAIEKS